MEATDEDVIEVECCDVGAAKIGCSSKGGGEKNGGGAGGDDGIDNGVIYID
jgi:hypothetical protein